MFSKSCQITVVSKHEKKTIALEKKKLAKVYVILYEKTTIFITWKL